MWHNYGGGTTLNNPNAPKTLTLVVRPVDRGASVVMTDFEQAMKQIRQAYDLGSRSGTFQFKTEYTASGSPESDRMECAWSLKDGDLSTAPGESAARVPYALYDLARRLFPEAFDAVTGGAPPRR